VILRSIAVPLRHLVEAIDGLGAGNLSVTIPPAGPDEIGAIAHTLGLFRDSLKERDRLAAEAETQRKTIVDHGSRRTVSEPDQRLERALAALLRQEFGAPIATIYVGEDG
jgi:methyl-accepting chemotaxis protein